MSAGGFVAEALAGRPAPAALFSPPLGVRPGSPEPTGRASVPPAEKPAASIVRSAAVSRRLLDDLFAAREAPAFCGPTLVE